MANLKCSEAGCGLDAVVETGDKQTYCEEHGNKRFKAVKEQNAVARAKKEPEEEFTVNPLYVSVCDAEGVHPIKPLRRASDGKAVE